MERQPPLSQQTQLADAGAEVRSYIYQTLAAFEPYTTPETEIAIFARDPSEIADLQKKKSSKKLHRICIAITNDGTRIESEGIDSDIYAAIRKAKESLLSQLEKIQDSVISSSERHNQLQSVMGKLLH